MWCTTGVSPRYPYVPQLGQTWAFPSPVWRSMENQKPFINHSLWQSKTCIYLKQNSLYGCFILKVLWCLCQPPFVHASSIKSKCDIQELPSCQFTLQKDWYKEFLKSTRLFLCFNKNLHLQKYKQSKLCEIPQIKFLKNLMRMFIYNKCKL